MRHPSTTVAAIAVAGLLNLLASQANALQIPFGAVLTGDQEVPPVATDANGLATLTYDDVAGTFDITVLVSGVELADLAANPGQFHLHGPAAVGAEAPPIVDLGSLGTFTAFPVPGGLLSFQLTGVALPAANEGDLLSGNTYLNLHTLDNPGGEVRGQLIGEAVPEPSTALMMVLGVTGLAFAGRRNYSREPGAM